MKHSLIAENPNFNQNGPIYMGAERTSDQCKVAIFGVPYDGTTSFRPGTRFGPSSIKEVSNSLETYCPNLNLDLNDIKYVDLGILEISHGAPEPVLKEVSKATQQIIDQNIKPLILGGEHSISSGAVSVIAKKHPELIMLQLDAHADLRDDWLGTKHNHACAMKRCLENLPSKKLFQLGIRSGTSKEFEELRNENRLIQFESSESADSLKQSLDIYIGKPLYLTIDIDWFDPSLVSGTGTPEPGGFFWNDFIKILNVIKNHNLVGADLVELAPQLDPSGISSIVAAKITRSLIMALSLD